MRRNRERMMMALRDRVIKYAVSICPPTRIPPSTPTDTNPAENQRQLRTEQDIQNEVDKAFGKSKKIGKKKAKKLALKEEKAKYREALKAKWEKEREEEERLFQARKEREAIEKEAEREMEVEIEKKRQERQVRDEADYQAFLPLFSVEGSGSMKEDHEVLLENVDEMIQMIKEKKVVYLHELALKYSVTTKIIVDLLNRLMERGDITGEIDDKGKFIYVTEEELDQMVQFINQRGRVNISDITKESHRFIQFE
eukprot:TRINITY_DN8004_c0_g1_i1.p2 TRINITY_DN8004_c0_g1~~TRINITY_DN8004_c0_g1_i1.p2  ORF type:complete len:254 (-),score=72.52 TRINITY_DN8004_c0_g1_i1:27-788(-)